MNMSSEQGKEQLAYFKIGAKIREHRREKNMKLIDLANDTKISSAMLSKIENGRIIPTIPTLFTIIRSLHVPVEVFFGELTVDDNFPGYIFLPRAGFTPYTKEENAIGFNYFSILERSLEGTSFQISLLELLPGATRPPVTTAAFEFVFLIDGSLNYQLEDQLFRMKQGDALFFDGNIPHVPVNNSKKRAMLLVLYLFTESRGSLV